MRQVSSARRAFALSLLALTLSCDDQPPLAPAIGAPLFFTTSPPPPVRISEIHYDNAGIDAGEAIEVSAPAGTSFASWSIVLYNGSGGAVYDTDALPLTAPIVCGARQVVVLTYPANGIQNGSPDGIALVGPSGVAEFLSYEGPFTAVGGPATGLLSTDIGVSENGSEPLGQSLKRDGFGGWSGPSASTFGTCNDEDPPPPAEVASVTVTPASATVVQGATQAFTAAAFDATSQPVAGVAFTWTSTDPAVATVSASGLATGVAPGDAAIIAAVPNGVADTAELQVDAPTLPPPPGSVHIVEVHYDNDGADAGEAIEVEGPAGTTLSAWSIVLYNGNGGASYGTLPLNATFADQCDGRGTVSILAPGLQNGAPDGLALVAPGDVVVEFLSYEGTFIATNGPASGMTSVDIGVDESGSEAAGRSLQKDASGWYGPVASSFGACNVKPPPAMSIFGRAFGDPPVPVGFQTQLFAEVRDASNIVLPTTITWSVDTPLLASIDEDGVVTALGEGTAIIRATGGADGTTGTFSLPTRVPVASTTAQYAGNAEFGEPADADPSDDFILRHDQYTSSFSHLRGTPNWVSYDLDATHIGPEDRCNCFTFDPALPASFTRYTTADYTGALAINLFRIDRGHLARSFDRTTGSLDNAFTFYFSNIIPQSSEQNQGPWSVMEMYLGNLARFSNQEVYIVAGVAGSRGTVKHEGKITIPAQTWKVALVLPRDHGLADVHTDQDIEELVAVIMPNDSTTEGVDWTTYKTTVDAVEALSGYDLLALLPDPIERIVEANDHPPVASAGGPYAGFEGSAVTFDASGSTDPDEGDALSFAWDWGDGSTGSGESPTHTYTDNGTFTVTVTVTDSYGATSSASASATISNVAPVITALTVPTAPVRLGSAATVSVAITDAGAGDTHIATVNWGDGSSSSSLSHAYAAPGLFFISVSVADDDGGSASASAASSVVVYDPNSMAAGAGVYGSAPNRSIFAFQARYLPGHTRPFAVLEHLNRLGLFSARSTDWLVVTGNKAILRGAGAIGRVRGYHFLWVAVAGRPDGVRLKIWNAAGVVVYDNQPDQPDTSDAVTPLSAGNVQVRR